MNDEQTDRIFKALADGTRRRILDLLTAKSRTTGELVEAFPDISRFAVMKHLGVLERAGLLVVTWEGRNRWNAINAVPLKDALRRWMGRHEEFLADMLLNVRDAAEGRTRGSSGAGKGKGRNDER